MSTPDKAPAIPQAFLPFADQGMYLALAAAGQHSAVQLLWRYRRPVDIGGLTRFRDNLAHGRLARLIRPAGLPFGRHQWASAPAPTSALAVSGAPILPESVQAWAEAQVGLPLDPVHGPGWTFTVQPVTDGSTLVSLVVSHCIADGMATVLAVTEAVRGERRALKHSAWQRQSLFGALTSELPRALRDVPATFRALGWLARTARAPRVTRNPPAKRPAPAEEDRTIAFPSACVRLPAADWDARARSLGVNRLSFMVAVTAAFAEALGRLRGGDVTVLIPVNQREGTSDAGANCVSLATLKVAAGESQGPLQALQRRLKMTLVRTRREPDPLAALLPLVPFVPRRAFLTARHLAFDALADLPVTCSYVGDLPPDVLRIDGAEADRLCYCGIEHQASLRDIETRQGVASLEAGAVAGSLLLNFTAYQPGGVTQYRELRALVEKLLAGYGLAGEFFHN